MTSKAFLLSAVTLTGADDTTDPQALVSLSRWAPRVEWGILYSPTRAGLGGRYPRVEHAVALLSALREEGIATAVHLCGQAVPDFLAGRSQDAKVLTDLAGRIQLNFNQLRSPVDLGRVDDIAEALDKPIITQHNAANVHVHEDLGSPVHQVLFDASGGRGTQPDSWPAPLPGKFCGYAGGLGPENVFAELDAIATACQGQRFWIDMESRVRTVQDVFDLDACAQVLTQVNRWIERARTSG